MYNHPCLQITLRPHVIRWGVNKHHLQFLIKEGVPCINTMFVEKGQAPSLINVMQKWPKIVLKPIVGLNSYQMTVIRDQENMQAKQEAFQAMLNDSLDGAMIQPFMPGAQTELSLIYLGGHYSHAIRLVPGDERRSDRHFVRCQPEADAMAVADCVIKACPWEQPLMSARVDLVEDFEEGGYKLMELEMIDPYLYLDEDNASALVDVIEKAIK
ncbi:hypothetical protein CAPTEDRAFT_200043 [Capitella teleta]|uniref:Prokaryotic glutathione synthetase ATP-binding domain-containing protein n=1 Tax=Capitella teleta TaxID=283909 RepID=R7UHQ4_CAPTE|nr:hypothetical protein CAPTEDRAFT_200043 [Capitella teleta]|eukprot:ELU05745.1 hypothetical protein CAPTEDRAFT_200043 [Capitella teleta]